MIRYQGSLLDEKHIRYVQTEGKNETITELSQKLNIGRSKVGKIRAYIRYEINKEQSYYDHSRQNKVFRKIPSLLYLYEISQDGVLRNVKSKRILKGAKDKFNYTAFTFMNRSIIKHYGTHHKQRLHQLLMEVWGPPKPFPEAVIDHIDRNKDNNNISNLRWVSTLGNYRNSVLWDGRPERQYKKVFVDGIEFTSLSEAGKYIESLPDIKITYKNIMDRMYRRRKHILGHDIKYII